MKDYIAITVHVFLILLLSMAFLHYLTSCDADLNLNADGEWAITTQRYYVGVVSGQDVEFSYTDFYCDTDLLIIYNRLDNTAFIEPTTNDSVPCNLDVQARVFIQRQ